MSSGWLQVWLGGLGQTLGRWQMVLWVVVLHMGAIPAPLSEEPKKKRQDLAAKTFLPSFHFILAHFSHIYLHFKVKHGSVNVFNDEIRDAPFNWYKNSCRFNQVLIGYCD